jgi:acetyl-CoA carboxylase beta subunit
MQEGILSLIRWQKLPRRVGGTHAGLLYIFGHDDPTTGGVDRDFACWVIFCCRAGTQIGYAGRG